MESTSMQKVRMADSDTTDLMMKLQYIMFCQCLSTDTATSGSPYGGLRIKNKKVRE